MIKKWLRTEWKRAVAILPAILKRAVLLVLVLGLVAGAAAFCVTMEKRTKDDGRLRVGYVAADNVLTDMAVSYVEQMESVRTLCELEQVSSKEQGLERLHKGELAALVVLPKNVVEEILSGKNTPVTVYLSADGGLDGGEFGAIKSLLFQELANAAVGMLEVAQAEIYAVQYVIGDLSDTDNALVQKLYDDINRFNISAAAGRENLFRTKSVSVTENDTYVIYYGSALMAVYVLLAGLFWGGFFCHREMWRTILEKRLGVSRLWQVLCGLLAGLLPMLVTLLLPFVCLLLPGVRTHLNVGVSLPVIMLLCLVAVFGVLYFMLVYGLFGERRSALLAIGISALIQAYLSGCIVPSVLLPDLAYRVGAVLPASFLKAAFTVVLSGDVQKFRVAALGLLAWSGVLLLLNVGQAYAARFWHDNSLEGAGRRCTRTGLVPPVVLVLFQRVLFRKGIWISLFVMAAVSVLITRLEARSETTFLAAVYDEGGVFGEQLLVHEGLVRFQMCESAAEVERLVLKDEVECGYVLPETLAHDMMAGRANRAVTVYEDVDSVCVPIVDEVLFQVLFGQASLAWYGEYLSGFGVDFLGIEEAVSSQIEGGRTFGIEIVTVGEDGVVCVNSEENGSFPVAAVVVAAVLLCGVQGFWTAMEDGRRGRFYKRGRIGVTVIMTVLPMVVAVVVGGGLLLWQGSFPYNQIK